MNICGPISNKVVVDIDIKPDKHGDVEMDALQERYGELPDTAAATTPSGGKHLFYDYPTDGTVVPSKNGVLAPAIDVKAKGGYVIVAPSRRGDDAYVWDDRSDPDDPETVYAELPVWIPEVHHFPEAQ